MASRVRMSVRTALLVAFLTAGVAPLLAYLRWAYDEALDAEVAEVSDKHLLIARNIADAIARRHREVIAAFDAFAPALAKGEDVGALTPLFDRVELRRACVYDAKDGTLRRAGPPDPSACAPRMAPERLAQLRLMTETSAGPVMSGVMIDETGRPCLKLAHRIGDRLVAAQLGTHFYREIADRNRFGVKGHVAIFDHQGRIVAHPRDDWVREARQISHLAPVRRALSGDEGVEVFRSPAFNGEMIAGVVPVAEIGWGVMAPQPMAELEARARRLTQVAILAAAVAIAFSAILAVLFARWIGRPIRRAAATARRVAEGDVSARIPKEDERRRVVELAELSRAFNTMARQIERAQKEEKRLRLEAELAAKGKSHFLANVSHEIRNPVNGLLGAAELMRRTELDDRQETLMNCMSRSGEQLTRLLDNVLDGARIESGMEQVAREPVDLRAALRDAAPRAEEIAGGAPVALELAADAPDAAIGDPKRLRQVLVTLAAGACRRAFEGVVRLVLEPASAHPGAAMIRILEPGVERVGPGPPELGEATAATLDLDIARSVIEGMGGEIGFAEREHGGVGIWILLPLAA